MKTVGLNTKDYKKFIKKNFPSHAAVITNGRRKAKLTRILYPLFYFGIPFSFTLLLAFCISLFKEHILLEINRNFSALFEKLDEMIFHTVLDVIYTVGFSFSFILGLIGAWIGFSIYKKDIFFIEEVEIRTRLLWLQYKSVMTTYGSSQKNLPKA
jgi:hypothetical protein